MTKIVWIGLLAMTLAACSGRTKTLRTETPAATPAAPRTLSLIHISEPTRPY